MSWRGGVPVGPGVAFTAVDAGTSSFPPAFDHATIAATLLASSCFECSNGTPTFDAGHGGMYFASTTVPIPSATVAASPAVSYRQWAAPTWPVVWHDAQFALRMGMTTFWNEGP